MRRAEQYLADVQRPPDPIADLRHEAARPRCVACGAPLADSERRYFHCARHRRDGAIPTRDALRSERNRADYLPVTVFDLNHYTWNERWQ